MEFSPEILRSTPSSRGMLLGGFYAAVAVGITIAFGMLDIVNIAHPAFIILGAFIAYYLNTHLGIDPLLAASFAAPCLSRRSGALPRLLFFLRAAGRGVAAGARILFRHALHRRGRPAAALRRRLSLRRGRPISARRWLWSPASRVPLRLLMPLIVGLGMVLAIHRLPEPHLHRPGDPGGFARSAARCGSSAATPCASRRSPSASRSRRPSLPGALLIIIQPVEPSVGPRFHRPRLCHLRARRHDQPRRHACLRR